MILPVEKEYVKSSWHLYSVRLKSSKERKAFFKKMRRSGIGVQVHYIPVHLQPYYRKTLGYKKNDFPEAEEYYSSEVSLPIYSALSVKELKYIIREIKNFFVNRKRV